LGVRIGRDISGGEGPVRLQKARINMLKAKGSTLPDEHSTTTFQERYLRVFLISGSLFVYPKYAQAS